MADEHEHGGVCHIRNMVRPLVLGNPFSEATLQSCHVVLQRASPMMRVRERLKDECCWCFGARCLRGAGWAKAAGHPKVPVSGGEMARAKATIDHDTIKQWVCSNRFARRMGSGRGARFL